MKRLCESLCRFEGRLAGNRGYSDAAPPRCVSRLSAPVVTTMMVMDDYVAEADPRVKRYQ